MANKKILVVDDELDTRTFLSTLLETSGYIPVLAVDGKEGILKARQLKPELIILDVMMPEEGGIQLYRDIKNDAHLRNTPVIMLSGIAKKTFFHALNMLNLNTSKMVPEPEAYIEKPPEPEELLAWTRSLLQT
ncbi:MAG: response regulator [Deltaproteobacteria bacterium]|nr:response regulator [Deltaproteobacteria bacterium]